MGSILVFNAGSSSIKFSIFEKKALSDHLTQCVKGHVAQQGKVVEMQVKNSEGYPLVQSGTPTDTGDFDHDWAIAQLLDWFDQQAGQWNFEAVGHRVVHGGQRYCEPVKITDAVLQGLDELVGLAPLHQPHNLKVIRLLRARWPGVVQVACFDTAFHHTQPEVAQAIALPRKITQAGVRRYGFHGLSYEYIATQLQRVLGDKSMGKVIVAHLGNGASLCGLLNGKSVASSMGFSALDGLVMGTRCGSIDPGVVLYMQQELNMTADEVSDMLYQDSGLLGVSGISGDMQVLLASKEPSAAQAIDLFVYRIVCETGALAGAMGGVDALVFTAGIGENAAPIRERVCESFSWLGAKLEVAVIPTDEEQMIALHTVAALAQS